MKTIAVIGLGKFGFYLAKNLSRQKYNVIAIDNNQQRVQQISDFIDHAYILDATNKNALEEAGVTDLDIVIVSIGENIEASILTVMALKDLGNKRVVAKAVSTTHGEILSKIGVSKVMHPEKIAGRALMKSLIGDLNVEKVDLSNSMRILTFKLPSHWKKKSIQELINTDKSVKLIAYKASGNWLLEISPTHTIHEDDIFSFLGNSVAIEAFYSKIIA